MMYKLSLDQSFPLSLFAGPAQALAAVQAPAPGPLVAPAPQVPAAPVLPAPAPLPPPPPQALAAGAMTTEGAHAQST